MHETYHTRILVIITIINNIIFILWRCYEWTYENIYCKTVVGKKVLTLTFEFVHRMWCVYLLLLPTPALPLHLFFFCSHFGKPWTRSVALCCCCVKRPTKSVSMANKSYGTHEWHFGFGSFSKSAICIPYISYPFPYHPFMPWQLGD